MLTISMIKPASIGRFAQACLFTGPVAAVLAPVLFPIVGLLVGEDPWPSALNIDGYLLIAVFALIVGFFGGLIVGLPSLLLLDAIDLNRPALLAIIGAGASCVIYSLLDSSPTQSPMSETWPLYLYVAAIGAACGAISSYRSLKEK